MAITINYQIEFFSDWHLGSGLSVAGDVDSAVLRDENGLPYIPGKTLKGLLRHAADTILAFQPNYFEKTPEKTSEFMHAVFGEKTDDEDKETPGQCFFSNAHLNSTLQENLLANKDAIPFLFRKIASTKIDDNGIAESQTLRKTEVTVPLVLEAEIDGIDREEWKGHFDTLFSMVKRMGLGRHRGLGRCQFSTK